MVNKCKKLIEQGELARERDDFETALVCFDKAIIASIKDSDYAAAINALGHHLLIYDHLYEQTSNPAFLEMMYMDAQTGLRLTEKNNIHGQPLALMQMRTAEYFLDIKEYAQAEEKYQEAFDELSADPNATNEEKAEYLGHLAEAIIYGGDVDRAEPLFRKAHELLEQSSDKLRDFHKLIIESGLLMREAHGLYLNDQAGKAKSLLVKVEPLVTELKGVHNMDARYKQFIELQNYDSKI